MKIRVMRNGLIPEHEIHYRFSASSKPGGQKVNKTSTRVTLIFDVARSESLTEDERARLMTALASRISKDGIFSVVSQKHRTQGANKEAARERFKELLEEALRPRRKRKPTVTPHEVKEQRLRNKRHRSGLKKDRARPTTLED
jgi:ribosome-associated protein